MTEQAPSTQALKKFLNELVDQTKARVIVPPLASQAGYWFGSGNLVEQQEPQTIWLCGRYRNAGDSRTGLQKGERGLSCALFQSKNEGESWTQVKIWTKQELSKVLGETVLSIEGCLLNRFYCPIAKSHKWEFLVSSEKEVDYSTGVENYRKPGTGVWSIDRMVSTSDSPDTLDLNSTKRCLETSNPCYLHVKDPALLFSVAGKDVLVFCTHPFSWTSCNTGVAVRDDPSQDFKVVDWEATHRGPCWDVASTRITGELALPEPWGDYRVYFYDGAECVRQHPPNVNAVARPRGSSCEEVSGAFLSKKAATGTGPVFLGQLNKLSVLESWFVSPHGTGCCRYIKTIKVAGGGLLVTWQQAQQDGSQPLVSRRFSRDEYERLTTQLRSS
eukprot:TRINITY_DN3216_c0_g2_i1.p1 TRINITY_DN3216_c0_g2~~TRINITY_DN3216_c0_g2_i1.p1  ORF type:complete len:387 (+),score=61.01 TRINITY_DN3216_c0_g2_i1:3-1163(+)